MFQSNPHFNFETQNPLPYPALLLMKIKKVLKKTAKWAFILAAGYWLITTLYFGYADVDTQKGMYTFYWSGLKALFNDEEFGIKRDKVLVTKLNGADGPYVFDSVWYTVNTHSELVKTIRDTSRQFSVKADNKDNDSFRVTLKDSIPIEQDSFPMPEQLLVLSDIEGNFNALHSFLINNGVMNKQYEWTYGRGHLVLDGDFIDRGKNTTQVLWLIYMLEAKALQQGGKVHYILGNHEIMNLYGDASSADFKYLEAAKRISGKKHWDEATRYIYSTQSELGKWLRSKNIVEKIGPYLFVHAGLKTEHVRHQLSIRELNARARQYYGIYTGAEITDPKDRIILSSYHSPYWDRSLSMNLTYRLLFLTGDPFHAVYHKTTQTELEQVLQFYHAGYLVTGHSVVPEVQKDYKGKVFKIDVMHGKEKNNSRTQGLFIDKTGVYKTDGTGKKRKL